MKRIVKFGFQALKDTVWLDGAQKEYLQDS